MLYRTKHAEFIYQDNGSPDIVVTFNTLTTRADGKRFFGDSFFNKHKMSVLGIVSTGRNWFPGESMEELCAAARPLLQRHGHVSVYATSMGAYGAIKYSRLLGAHSVAAFSPQFSIDPRDLAVPSPMSIYYDESLHRDVTIEARDLGGNIFIFHDPHDEHDTYAAESIARLGESVRLVPIPLVGHTTWAPFIQPNRILEVLQLCREAPSEATGKLIALGRTASRHHRLRKQHLALFLAARHPRWALAIWSRYPEIFDDGFLNKICKVLLAAEKIDPALEWARKSHDQNPSDFSAIKILTAFLRTAGDFDSALALLKQALSLEPANHHLMIALSRVHWESALAQARVVLEKDLSFLPTDPALRSNLNRACAEFPAQKDALLWARKAVETMPGDLATFRHLASLHKKSGAPQLSLEVLSQAFEHHPANVNLAAQIELETQSTQIGETEPEL